MLNINKFVNSNDDSSIFHTSGYAKVAQGGALGATSAETFSQRRRREHQRSTVARYHDSMLASGHMREVAKDQLNSSSVAPRPKITSKQPRSNRQLATPPPRQAFREPGGRGFNPYS